MKPLTTFWTNTCMIYIREMYMKKDTALLHLLLKKNDLTALCSANLNYGEFIL